MIPSAALQSHLRVLTRYRRKMKILWLPFCVVSSVWILSYFKPCKARLEMEDVYGSSIYRGSLDFFRTPAPTLMSSLLLSEAEPFQVTTEAKRDSQNVIPAPLPPIPEYYSWNMFSVIVYPNSGSFLPVRGDQRFRVPFYFLIVVAIFIPFVMRRSNWQPKR